MKKSWGLTQKILKGEKTIESRWYATKRAPWNTIQEGNTVYFKDSGGPVQARAEVDEVIQFADLTPTQVREILNEYANEIGLEDTSEFFGRVKNKKYCILVFLKNPHEVTPFNIDKTGFGTMSSWITVNDISKIKI